MSLQRQASRAGVSPEVYQSFLEDLNGLTSRYQQYGADRFSNGFLQEQYIADGNAGEEFNLSGPMADQLRIDQQDVMALQDQYENDFLALTKQYGVTPITEDDGKIYAISPGNPFASFGVTGNPYGEAFQPVGGFGSEPGAYYRDTRTDSADFADVLAELVPNSPGEILKFALTAGTSQAYGAADAFMALSRGGYNAFRDAQSSFAPQEGGDLQGQTYNSIDSILDTINGVVTGVFGDSDPNGISIPIPGLPISIPGNMSFEDLLDAATDLARSTGESVSAVLDKILGGLESAGQPQGSGAPEGPPQQPPESVEEEGQANTAVCSLGRPQALTAGGATPEQAAWDLRCGQSHNWDGSTKGSQDVRDSETETPGIGVNTPGVVRDSETETPGFAGAAGLLAGLVPLALRADRPERTRLTPGRTLMQANESRLSDRPDYGQPTPMGLFDFGERISQPTQVGYGPEARRETMSATERERLRRMQRQGLL